MGKRNPAALEDGIFDLLVIGGGINGAAITWDATLRGLRVALVDRSDFGGATSAGSFKIIHGGLRYLQNFDLPRIFESLREQRILRCIAPHLVHPLPFLVPCYGYGAKGLEFLRAGLSLYDTLAFARNKRVFASHFLPRHRRVSREECLEIAPHLAADGLRGGVLFYDCQMSNSERLTLAYVLSAAARGAVVCNYVEATGFETEQISGSAVRIEAVRARDVFSEGTLRIQAKVVVNCAGPWTEVLRARVEEGAKKLPFVYSKGVQLVLPPLVQETAVALESRHRDREAAVRRGNRSYFLVPWRGHSLLGTADIVQATHPDEFRITQEEIDRFLREAREIYPDERLNSSEVRFVFGGLRPVERSVRDRAARGMLAQHGSVEAARRDTIVDHAQEPFAIGNLLSVIGIKYTTARALAERVVDTLAHKGLALMRCSTQEQTVNGGDTGDFSVFERTKQAELGRIFGSSLPYLLREYGSEIDKLVHLAMERLEWAQRLGESRPDVVAQVVHAVRSEMACTLSDVVFRRTGLGTLGTPGAAALEKAGRFMAAELEWSAARTAKEIETVGNCFLHN